MTPTSRDIAFFLAGIAITPFLTFTLIAIAAGFGMLLLAANSGEALRKALGGLNLSRVSQGQEKKEPRRNASAGRQSRGLRVVK